MRLNHMINQYHLIKDDIESIRLGQHFINLCIEDSSTPLMQELWEAKETRALEIIWEVMEQYHWKENFLPVHSECVYYGAGGWAYNRLELPND